MTTKEPVTTRRPVPNQPNESSRGLATGDWRMLVGGDLGTAANGRRYNVEDPSRAEVIASVPDADDADVAAAVQRAGRASRPWRMTSAAERGRLVRQFATRLGEHSEELALLDSLNGGIPITAARADVAGAIQHMHVFADWAMLATGQTIPASAENLHMTLREPYGVVGRIIPFNHPFLFAATKIAAPLVAGNSVVLKLPDQAPLSGLRLGEIAAEVLPPGVLSVISGQGPASGRALVSEPTVRRIAFTGSLATGLSIQRLASEVGVKHVSLELGGKNAMIVFPDTDVDTAVAGAVQGMNLGFVGQSCGSNSRLLVHESIAGDVIEGLADAFRQLRVGIATEDETQVGPLISGRQHERVLDFIAVGRSEGAVVRAGGGRPDALDRGYFVAPTVLDEVTPSHRLFREEIFGPVISVVRFSDEAEAVTLANDVEYGLTASVWTRDVARAHRVARDIEAGYVWINDSNTHYLGTPFGGYKNSGTGREESLEELLSYTQTKSVHVMLR